MESRKSQQRRLRHLNTKIKGLQVHDFRVYIQKDGAEYEGN